MKLTPKRRELLERIVRQDGKLLLLQVTGSGGRAPSMLRELRRADYVEVVDHPTVTTPGGEPAQALRATATGIEALHKPT